MKKKSLLIFFLAFFLQNILIINIFSDINNLFKDETLIISNFPEAIDSPGLIFEKKISERSLRVFYHHKNILNNKLTIIINVTNIANKPIVFDLQHGLGGSTKDVVFAGHKSATDFMKQLLVEPQKIEIPAQSTAVIIKHVIKPQEVSSGHLRIATEEKNKLILKMGVIDEEYPQLSLFRDISRLSSQFKVIHANKSSITINQEFDCAKKIDALEIGGKPYIKDIVNEYSFTGNYGVMYVVKLKLINSLFSAKEVKLFFSPKKNNAIDRGVVILENQVKEIGLLTQKNNILSMEKFYSTMVGPNETKNVSFLLFPQAGCYYPIDIIIKADERLL